MAYIDPKPMFPGMVSTPSYTQNPIGGVVSQGYYSDQSRTGAQIFLLIMMLENLG